jgi:molybdate transport system substrate-binding protein
MFLIEPAKVKRIGRMNKPLQAPARVVFAFAAILALPTMSFAQVKVIISGGFSPAYRELVPEFEKDTGITVTTTSGGSVGSGPNTIGGQIRRGVPADVVILAREGLSDLIAEGRMVAGTDVDLARSIIGMIVRAGAPKPDISTVDALKQALLHAKSVAMSSSTSGVYLTTVLFPKLGIADQMAAKISTNGAAAVGRGEAEIGLQQVSEVLAVPGVDFVGSIPAEVQYVTTYAAAVVMGSTEVDASRRLIAFLSSERASAAIKKSGMEPSRSR